MKPKSNKLQSFEHQKIDEKEVENYQDEDLEADESIGGKECGMCHDVPESIIYLSCEHIVCLVCAAKLILGNHDEKQPINLSEVICGICNETTVLSVEVQETLVEFLQQQDYDDEDENENENEEKNNSQNEEESQNNEKSESEENSVQIRNSISKKQVTESNAHEESVRNDNESKVIHNESEVKRNSKKLEQKSQESKIKEGMKKSSQMGKDCREDSNKSQPKISGQSSRKNERTSDRKSKKGDTHIQQKGTDKLNNQRQTEQNQNFKKDNRKENRTQQEEYEEDKSNEEENEEFMTTFYCIKHTDEEYTYYNPETRNLYCAQCLISEINSKEELTHMRPLKKCLPEILQNFQDMLNEIEVTKSLLENKKKDFEIRKEGSKVHSVSLSKKLELAFDEIIDYVQEQKMKSLKNLESKNKLFLKDLDGKEESIDERIGYFNGILDEVNALRQDSNSPEEELFVFFFTNQEKIGGYLKDENNQTSENETLKINKIFDDFSSKTRQEQVKQIKTGQENIREKLFKSISSLPNINEEKVTLGSNSKTANQTAEFAKTQLSATKPGFTKPSNSLFTLGDAENSNMFANRAINLTNEQVMNSKRLNTFTNSETYNQFVEKVRALPSRPNSSLETAKYINQMRGLSRGTHTTLAPDNSILSKDYQSNGYYKTLSKNNYNLEKKMELEHKLKFFDLKMRKEEPSGFQVLSGFNTKNPMMQFQSISSGINKSKLDTKTDFRNTTNISQMSGLKSGGWMFGK